jgi:SAM-dependent methyltransferase
MKDDILARVSKYYSAKLAEHGETPRGVDWNSTEAQQVRFTQILSICRDDPAFSINDIGCGYGALVERLVELPGFLTYTGFDIAEPMIEAARRRYPTRHELRFTSRFEDVPVADYTVASGIFSVKGDVPEDAWHRYVMETIDDLRRLSRRGFAFNCLTAFSDPDRMRPDLHYADPHAVFDHCRRRYARNVALLHDYGIFEFTIRVRLD